MTTPAAEPYDVTNPRSPHDGVVREAIAITAAAYATREGKSDKGSAVVVAFAVLNHAVDDAGSAASDLTEATADMATAECVAEMTAESACELVERATEIGSMPSAATLLRPGESEQLEDQLVEAARRVNLSASGAARARAHQLKAAETLADREHEAAQLMAAAEAVALDAIDQA